MRKRINKPVKVLWVTSFATDMYAVSGKPFIRSFGANRIAGDLLVCTEGVSDDDIRRDLALTDGRPTCGGSRVLFRSLHGSDVLLKFLAKNAEVVPTHLGGSASGECTCAGGPYPPRYKKHAPACIGQWFCRNAFRWFRKFAAITEGLQLAALEKYDTLIWLDADCEFRAKITLATVSKWFAGDSADIFYLKHSREVVEGCCVGYRMTPGGKRILAWIIDEYLSGRFRCRPRWDDSYIVQQAMLANKSVVCRDLARGVGEHAAVVPFSLLHPCIMHDKGRHGRKLGIMT